MSKLMRFLSGRWTSRTPPQMDGREKSGGLGTGHGVQQGSGIVCRVSLLDGTDIVADVPRKALGAVLYDRVFQHLDLIESEYFGLQYTDELGTHCWLDSTKSIRRQVQRRKNNSDGQPFLFRFKVKFYSSDPNNLREEITRYQMFLQLKADIQSGKLRCPEPINVELAALALQSELGDYDERDHTLGFVSEFRFVPNQTEDLERQIFEKYKAGRGLTPAMAELSYLNKVRRIETYGVDFYSVLAKDGNEYKLGLTPSGILVFEGGYKIGLFFWPKITKLQFRKRRLKLEVVEEDEKGLEQEHTFIFRADSEKACKNLWKCAVEHHTFFRLTGGGRQMSTSQGLFRAGSKFRYSGRTEAQTASMIRGRRSVRVDRRPSQRYSRRPVFDKQEKERMNIMQRDMTPDNRKQQYDSTFARGSSRRKSNRNDSVDNQYSSTLVKQNLNKTDLIENQYSSNRRRSKDHTTHERTVNGPKEDGMVFDRNMNVTSGPSNTLPVPVLVSMSITSEDNSRSGIDLDNRNQTTENTLRRQSNEGRTKPSPSRGTSTSQNSLNSTLHRRRDSKASISNIPVQQLIEQKSTDNQKVDTVSKFNEKTSINSRPSNEQQNVSSIEFAPRDGAYKRRSVAAYGSSRNPESNVKELRRQSVSSTSYGAEKLNTFRPSDMHGISLGLKENNKTSEQQSHEKTMIDSKGACGAYIAPYFSLRVPKQKTAVYEEVTPRSAENHSQRTNQKAANSESQDRRRISQYMAAADEGNKKSNQSPRKSQKQRSMSTETLQQQVAQQNQPNKASEFATMGRQPAASRRIIHSASSNAMTSSHMTSSNMTSPNMISPNVMLSSNLNQYYQQLSPRQPQGFSGQDTQNSWGQEGAGQIRRDQYSMCVDKSYRPPNAGGYDRGQHYEQPHRGALGMQLSNRSGNYGPGGNYIQPSTLQFQQRNNYVYHQNSNFASDNLRNQNHINQIRAQVHVPNVNSPRKSINRLVPNGSHVTNIPITNDYSHKPVYHKVTLTTDV